MKTRYLLDTGPAQDYLFRRRGALARVEALRRAGARVGICKPVLGELYSGVELSSSRDKNLKILQRNLVELVCWPYDRTAAIEFGNVFASLRRKGRPIQQIDMQIAAIVKCLGNCTLITFDTDFQAVDGLTIDLW